MEDERFVNIQYLIKFYFRNVKVLNNYLINCTYSQTISPQEFSLLAIWTAFSGLWVCTDSLNDISLTLPLVTEEYENEHNTTTTTTVLMLYQEADVFCRTHIW